MNKAADIFIFLIMLFFNSCIAQKILLGRDENGNIYQESTLDDEKKIIKAYFITENGDKIKIGNKANVATFFEGEDKIEQFIDENLIYPKNFEIHGQLIFAILVDSVGNISHIRLLKKTFNCIDCITNALKVIEKMKWIAGKNESDEYITSIRYLTIKFK